MSDNLTDRVNAALEGIETWSVVGDWVAVSVNQCTCWGGDAHYGHQPGCGFEPVGKVDEPIMKLAVAARELLPELVAEVERLRAAPLFVYHVTYWDPCNGISGYSQSHGYFATEELAKAYVEPRSTGWDVNAYTITAIEVSRG